MAAELGDINPEAANIPPTPSGPEGPGGKTLRTPQEKGVPLLVVEEGNLRGRISGVRYTLPEELPGSPELMVVPSKEDTEDKPPVVGAQRKEGRPVFLTSPRDGREYNDLVKKGKFSPRKVIRDQDGAESEFVTRNAQEYEEKYGGQGAVPKDKWYDYYDSPLNYPQDPESLEIYPYSFDFMDFAPDDMTFQEYVQDGVPPNGIGADLGGPGSALFADFDEGTFAQTFGFTLADIRTDEVKARDAARGHEIIPGDFRQNWYALDKKLDGRPVNTWFMRLVAGEGFLDQNPYKQSGQAQEVFRRMEGTIFATTTRIMRPLIEPWQQRVANEAGDTVRVRALGNDEVRALEIVRKPGAPQELPMLTAREVRRAYTDWFDKRASADGDRNRVW